MPSDANGRSNIAIFHTIPHSQVQSRKEVPQKPALGHVLPESNLSLFRNCMRMQILNVLRNTMYVVVAVARGRLHLSRRLPFPVRIL